MNCRKILRNFVFGPIPPPEPQKSGYGFFGKSPANRSGGNTADNGIGSHVFGHHRPGAYDSAVSDRNAGKHHCLIANPDVIANDDVALVVPRAGDVLPVQSPFLIKKVKGIGGK